MGHLAKLSKILVPNNSFLPADTSYITEKRLSIATFSVEDIEKIILQKSWFKQSSGTW